MDYFVVIWTKLIVNKMSLQDLHEVLEKNKPLLLSAEDCGRRLVEGCGEELVATQLDPLQQAFEILFAAVVEREGQLQMKLVQTQSLDTSLSDFLRWLMEMERTISRQDPIALEPVKVNRQRNDQEVSCDWFVTCGRIHLHAVCLAVSI